MFQQWSMKKILSWIIHVKPTVYNHVLVWCSLLLNSFIPYTLLYWILNDCQISVITQVIYIQLLAFPGLWASQDLAETAKIMQDCGSKATVRQVFPISILTCRFITYCFCRHGMNKVHTVTDIFLSSINKQMGYFIKLSGKTGTFKHHNMFTNEITGSNFNAFCLLFIYLYRKWIKWVIWHWCALQHPSPVKVSYHQLAFHTEPVFQFFQIEPYQWISLENELQRTAG